jgi:hypothetical protein
MGKRRATEEGDDADTVNIYGEEGVGLWGACPENNDGAYYPVITVED